MTTFSVPSHTTKTSTPTPLYRFLAYSRGIPVAESIRCTKKSSKSLHEETNLLWVFRFGWLFPSRVSRRRRKNRIDRRTKRNSGVYMSFLSALLAPHRSSSSDSVVSSSRSSQTSDSTVATFDLSSELRFEDFQILRELQRSQSGVVYVAQYRPKLRRLVSSSWGSKTVVGDSLLSFFFFSQRRLFAAPCSDTFVFGGVGVLSCMDLVDLFSSCSCLVGVILDCIGVLCVFIR